MRGGGGRLLSFEVVGACHLSLFNRCGGGGPLVVCHPLRVVGVHCLLSMVVMVVVF